MITIPLCILFCSWAFALGYLLCKIRAKAKEMKLAHQAAIDTLREKEAPKPNTGITDEERASYIKWQEQINTTNLKSAI